MPTLLNRWFPLLLSALVCLPSSAFARAPSKRPITFDDLWKLQRVGAPSISPDGKWAAVEVTSYDMEENDSTSQVWLLSTDGKTQKKLTTSKGKNSGPKWSPDGKWIAFVSKRGKDSVSQIYLISPRGGEARKLSTMPIAPLGLRWGGDSKTVYCIAWSWPDTPDDASFRKKEKSLKDSKVKAFVIDDAQYRYWDRWIADGKRPTVFAVDVSTGKHRNLLAGTGMFLSPNQPSVSDYDVSPDGKELCFVADSVKAIGTDANLDLYTLDLGDKKAKPANITTDNPANDTSPVYSPDGKTIAFLRQKVKFFYADLRRLMVHDLATGKKRELTATLDRSCGNPRWLADGKELCFEAENKGYLEVYQVEVETPKPSTVHTGFSDLAVDLARQGRMAVFARTSFDLPPTIFAGRLGDKEAKQISFFNDALAGTWKLGKVEEVWFEGADGDKVQMWVIYPPDFDAKKKWPLVQVIHGGPHNGIPTAFHFRWNLQLWAARGYVIGCVNFHGSSGFGQKFCDSITGDYATKPTIDILKGTDWFEKQTWIDKERMAAAGGSYGGYMVAWLNGHTTRFKAMICHAGVYSYHAQMASDVVRGRERALGAFPWTDLGKIDRQSAQRYSAKFSTPTLVLHGEKDYRVPVTQGFEYYNTLKLKGVPARLVYFPDENHWVLKPQNARLWHREVFAWLEKYIGRGPGR